MRCQRNESVIHLIPETSYLKPHTYNGEEHYEN